MLTTTTGARVAAEAPPSSSSRLPSSSPSRGLPSSSPYAAAEPTIGPFWGCLQRFTDGVFGVFVPDVEDSAAAGDSKEEALLETSRKLSSQLRDVPRDQVPAPSDLQTATAKARAFVDADAGEFIHEESWEMVQVPVDFSLVVDLPAAVLEQLKAQYCT
ncbi:hypothetical protein HYH02_013338 [Chlamydomonas schloesseri]|uniref:Uncharacterized protein n=1 Tax=Chlamydomonas schloesseri TaxID=2026947 RepID=A0A835SQH5_9CHLO|nr:hypothetical protein HYH02_013338 [Chlamydomonas schloesseri]|eukprot:KAG2431348.1 hypothetical protein HYH02_013338 [Chlamydomonas schloesseri]